MLLLVLSMLTVTVLGIAVVGYVAVPAHRGGRGLLTTKGADLALSLRRRVAAIGTRARTH
jgi:hypothetical protein